MLPALIVGLVRLVVLESVSPFAFVKVIWKPVVPPKAEETEAAVVMLATKLIRHIPTAYPDPEAIMLAPEIAAD